MYLILLSMLDLRVLNMLIPGCRSENDINNYYLLLLLTLCRESVAQKKNFPSYLQTNALIIYLDFPSTKQALWLVDSRSHAPDPIQMYPDWEKIVQLLLMCLVQQHVAICLRENIKYITKHLIYGPLGNWLVFVLPDVSLHFLLGNIRTFAKTKLNVSLSTIP